MRIAEIYPSIQGEGPTLGLPMVFVRTQGCTVGCRWCDSAFTWSAKRGNERSVDDVVADVEKTGLKWVCLTGGEPLEQRDPVEQLCWALSNKRIKVLLETSGCYPVDKFVSIPGVMVDCDVKTPSAKAKYPFVDKNLDILGQNPDRGYIKFVISDLPDYVWMKEWLASRTVPLPPVWLQCDPDGIFNTKRAADEVVKDRLDVHVGVQLHKILWGKDTRGV